MPPFISNWLAEWSNPYKRYQHHRAMHAIRLSLAVVCAILIAHLGNIEHGEWIAMTVFVLLGSVPYQGAINSKAYERIIGTVLGMAIGIALIWLNHHFLHNSPLYFLIIAIVSAISGWHTLGNYGYAAMLAGLTMALNGIDRVGLREGSLYEPVDGERFDLIVTNPPYVMSPPDDGAERLVYREGSFAGDGLVERVVRRGPRHLTGGGLLQVLANWADGGGARWQDRLSGWAAGTGCDLWVIQRERLDVYEYIEMWLTDAGLAGSDEWGPRYRRWLDYFERLGITGVGMGWIMLRNSGAARPRIRIEEWPYDIGRPVGPALSSGWRTLDARSLDDDALLATRCTLDPDVVQETTGAPGAADPSHVVLRRTTGLRRAIEVDTALGGVLGACHAGLLPGAWSWAASGAWGYSDGGCHDWFAGPSVSLVMTPLWHVAMTFSSDLRRRWGGTGAARRHGRPRKKSLGEVMEEAAGGITVATRRSHEDDTKASRRCYKRGVQVLSWTTRAERRVDNASSGASSCQDTSYEHPHPGRR